MCREHGFGRSITYSGGISCANSRSPGRILHELSSALPGTHITCRTFHQAPIRHPHKRKCSPACSSLKQGTERTTEAAEHRARTMPSSPTPGQEVSSRTSPQAIERQSTEMKHVLQNSLSLGTRNQWQWQRQPGLVPVKFCSCAPRKHRAPCEHNHGKPASTSKRKSSSTTGRNSN